VIALELRRILLRRVSTDLVSKYLFRVVGRTAERCQGQAKQ
jgi:hypothetical protein